jgi:acetoin utilization deacetylase AcuC-like enzyme
LRRSEPVLNGCLMSAAGGTWSVRLAGSTAKGASAAHAVFWRAPGWHCIEQRLSGYNLCVRCTPNNMSAASAALL